MKRPQSAKPGYRGNWVQNSAENINEQSQLPKNVNRKQIKIMKPDLTTHDFARILPRKIQQDKQRLYSEALQLRQHLNEVTEENIRFKTKISILEREKDKLNKFMDTGPQGFGGKGSRINIYQARSNEKENMIVRNLKKIVRQARQQNDNLKAENQKIKKMMKYTNINQLEIERKVVIDENKRLSALLEQYNSHIIDQQQLEKQNSQLRKYLQQELEERQQICQQKDKYQQIIESLEEKIKIQTQKYQSKEKKMSRDVNSQKRRVQQLQRKNQDLIKQLKALRQNQQNASRQLIKPNSNIKNTLQKKINTFQSQQNKESAQKYDQINKKNQILQNSLQEIIKKLRLAQQKISQFENKQKILLQTLNKQAQNAKLVQENDNQVKTQKQAEKRQQQRQDHNAEQYDDQFERDQPKIEQNQDQQIIKDYKKDFEENEQEQELYKRQQEKPKNKVNSEQSDKTKIKNKQKNQNFKPDKKVLSEIKQLLTIRMKSQRYPFKDIQADIQSAESSQFTYTDLCNMLVNEPFYLTSSYTTTFLQYCYEKKNIQPSEVISHTVLISKLRKVIDDFDLLQQDEEKQMILKIAEMTSTYPRELQVAFQNIKNGQQTISRQNLIQLFQKLELEDKYIDLIIGQLSLCSDDLEHLNFHGYFERFYMEAQEQDEFMNNNAIQEEESEESHRHSSRVKKSARGAHLNNAEVGQQSQVNEYD